MNVVEFAVYNTETGEILRTGSCPEEMVSIQARRELQEEVVIGYADQAAHHVVNGKLALLPDDVAFRRKNRPAEGFFSWDHPNGVWLDRRSDHERATAQRRKLLGQINALEQKQARSLRELATGRGNQADAKKRLEDLDDQIAALRLQLPEV